MNKQEFLLSLEKGLLELPKVDVEERLTFYSEIIDDRIEEGFSEEEAVFDIGSVAEITAQIISDIPLSEFAKERVIPKRRLKAWEVLFLILGSPIWLSLCIALMTLILSVYFLLWTAIILLWAVFGSMLGCAVGVTAAGMILAFGNNLLTGIAVTGAGMVCAGFSVFDFYVCKSVSRGILKLTKKLAILIKKQFIKKGVV